MLTLEKKTLKKRKKRNWNEVKICRQEPDKTRTRFEWKREVGISDTPWRNCDKSPPICFLYVASYIYWLYVLLFRVCEPFVPLQITVTNGSKRPVICNKGLASERRRQDDWSRTGDEDGPDKGASPKVWSKL